MKLMKDRKSLSDLNESRMNKKIANVKFKRNEYVEAFRYGNWIRGYIQEFTSNRCVISPVSDPDTCILLHPSEVRKITGVNETPGHLNCNIEELSQISETPTWDDTGPHVDSENHRDVVQGNICGLCCWSKIPENSMSSTFEPEKTVSETLNSLATFDPEKIVSETLNAENQDGHVLCGLINILFCGVPRICFRETDYKPIP